MKKVNITFETEKVFKWSKNKRYDFYLPSLNMIIEAHGGQHYKKNQFEFQGGKTVKEEQENDKLKEQLAKENGIENYIVIDCSQDIIKDILYSVLDSDLFKYIKKPKFQLTEIIEYCSNNKVKEICNSWDNESRNIEELSSRFNMSKSTIMRYLKQGSIMGWCKYSTKEDMKTYNYTNIIRLWNDERMSPSIIAKKMSLSKTTVLKYLHVGVLNNECDYDAKVSLKMAGQTRAIPNAKPIIFINTGQYFKSIQSVAQYFDIKVHILKKHLNGEIEYIDSNKGNEESKKFMFYEDYLNKNK